MNADVIIKNALVLTMDPHRTVWDDGAVVVKGPEIIAVGPSSEMTRRYRAARTIDGIGRVVMPGLINAHTHVNQVLLRGGLSSNRELYDWMFNVLYPGLAQLDPDEVGLATALFCAEAIRSGTTTVVENADQGRDDRIARATIAALADTGIRAVYARLFWDYSPPELDRTFAVIEKKAPTVKHPSDLMENGLEALAHTEELIKRYHGSADGRISVWPAPALPLTTTEEALLASAELADKYDVMVTIHHAEAPLDAEVHGMSATEYLFALGFLSPRVQAAHCVWLNPRDIRLLRAHDVKVVHLPQSNMYLAAGIAPVARMVNQGLTVALGTDDANCNDSVNLFQEMKAAVLLQRAALLDPAALTPDTALAMATIEGARAISMDRLIGSLETGKRADLIILNPTACPQCWPVHDLASMLVFQAQGTEVETCLVDGRIVMEEHRLAFLSEADEAQLYRDVQAVSTRLVQEAGLSISGAMAFQRDLLGAEQRRQRAIS